MDYNFYKSITLNEILEWSQNKLVNPKTDRKIKKDGKTYLTYEKKLKKFFPNNITYLDSVDNIDPISRTPFWIMHNNKKKFVHSNVDELVLYKDIKNRVCCFEIDSLRYIKHFNVVRHPITNELIPESIINLVKDDNITIEKNLKEKSLEIFQLFVNISIFIDYNDFLNLNEIELDKLYYETRDFFYKNINNNKIIKIKDMANNDSKESFHLDTNEFNNLNISDKKEYLLDSFYYLLNFEDDEVKYLGKYIVLGGLGLVIPKIKSDYPDFCFNF